MLRKRTDTPELRDHWDAIRLAADEVASWPDWKRGDYSALRADEQMVEAFLNHRATHCQCGAELKAEAEVLTGECNDCDTATTERAMEHR